MKETEKLKDTPENYSRLIVDINEQNDALKRMRKNDLNQIEKLQLEEAIFQNELAINRACISRLKCIQKLHGED